MAVPVVIRLNVNGNLPTVIAEPTAAPGAHGIQEFVRLCVTFRSCRERALSKQQMLTNVPDGEGGVHGSEVVCVRL